MSGGCACTHRSALLLATLVLMRLALCFALGWCALPCESPCYPFVLLCFSVLILSVPFSVGDFFVLLLVGFPHICFSLCGLSGWLAGSLCFFLLCFGSLCLLIPCRVPPRSGVARLSWTLFSSGLVSFPCHSPSCACFFSGSPFNFGFRSPLSPCCLRASFSRVAVLRHRPVHSLFPCILLLPRCRFVSPFSLFFPLGGRAFSPRHSTSPFLSGVAVCVLASCLSRCVLLHCLPACSSRTAFLWLLVSPVYPFPVCLRVPSLGPLRLAGLHLRDAVSLMCCSLFDAGIFSILCLIAWAGSLWFSCRGRSSSALCLGRLSCLVFIPLHFLCGCASCPCPRSSTRCSACPLAVSLSSAALSWSCGPHRFPFSAF